MAVNNESLFNEGIYRKCVGDRATTRNTLNIEPGQIILIRRGIDDYELQLAVTYISFKTFLHHGDDKPRIQAN